MDGNFDLGGGDGGGHGWGGGGLGWFFPALLVGNLISNMFERRPVAGPWPAYALPQTQTPPAAGPPAPASAVPAAITCQNCQHTVEAGFAFCPQCGAKVTPAACRYCGAQLKPERRLCAQCGGPQR